MSEDKSNRVPAAITVDDFRLVKVQIRAADPDARPDLVDEAIYLGIMGVNIDPDGKPLNIWYEPTFNGMVVSSLPEEVLNDLNFAVEQWDAAKAAGTLTKREDVQAVAKAMMGPLQ